MGTSCSNERKPVEPDLEKDESPPLPRFGRHTSTRLRKVSQVKIAPKKRSQKEIEREMQRENHYFRSSETVVDMASASNMVTAQESVIAKRVAHRANAGSDVKKRKTKNSTGKDVPIETAHEKYLKQREDLAEKESIYGFDYICRAQATADEAKADRVLQQMRMLDEASLGRKPKRQGFGGQEHARFAGDHFLSNVDLISDTYIYKAAQRMPKGAHLHIHFNACLAPRVLLDIAKDMDHMVIMSDLPLTDDERTPGDNYDRCRITFQIELQTKVDNAGNLFRDELPHQTDKDPPRYTMKFQEFLAQFKGGPEKAFDWLVDKLVFHEEEVHDKLQTPAGAWEKFNYRTQMMKGLFNYESAYEQYTRKLLEDFVHDNIQYAEIRPNFMQTNQVWKDDATDKRDNFEIMDMIIAEFEKFQKNPPEGRKLGGLKVIYCTPRSFPPKEVAKSLAECLTMKRDPKYGKYIAGFDLVGEEGKGRPLKDFIPELLQFQSHCAENKVEIPFLFHCGETLEMGTGTDGNLLDALLLKSKRIGHGFSLARHPYIMERMKERGVCLELCPISNEVLGLTPRVAGHAMYNLLANNVHCTVNSDNGTLFRSSLSHDFYQVFVGKRDMSLFGWKQLILWSLEHSCLTEPEYKELYDDWSLQWEAFISWLIKEGRTIMPEDGEAEPRQ